MEKQESVIESVRENDAKNETHKNLTTKGGGGGGTNTNLNNNKGKSCKGCLYYSSSFKSNSRNPLCVGISRSLPQVPQNIVGKSEVEAHEKGRDFAEFRYGCVGYSVYSDRKGQKDVQDGNSELPACIGIEVLVDRKVTGADSVPAHAHNRQDNRRSPQPQTQKPAPQTQKPAVSVGDEFLKRFTRNAGLVAAGVAKNVKRVGNHVKASVDDILYPYRRPPK